VVAASSPVGDQGPIVQAVITVQRCVRVAQVGLVLFLMVFSRYLGVSWRQHSFGISTGLGLAAGVELGSLAFHVSGHASEVIVQVTNLVAYNLAIAIWFGYALRPSPERTASPELFTSHRWEKSLTDLQSPAQADSLIPMFESMVDRALSRTQIEYPPKTGNADSRSERDLPAERRSLRPVLAHTRRIQ